MRERITIYITAHLLKNASESDVNIIKSICLDHTGCINNQFDLLVSNREISNFYLHEGSQMYHFLYQGYFRFDTPVIQNFIDWVSEFIPFYENSGNFIGYIKHDDLKLPEFLCLKVIKHVEEESSESKETLQK